VTVTISSKRTTYGEAKHQGVDFFIKYISERKRFGTKTIWRNNIKVQISDLHKTLLDITDDPYLGAGLQHTIDCFAEYKKIANKEDGLARLLELSLIHISEPTRPY